MSTLAFIGVGSNLGDRNVWIKRAKDLLSQKKGIRFLRTAPVYETDPVGGPPQGRFLNTVWEIETDLSAREILVVLLDLEASLGRKRTRKNEPRVIDLDLLFYGDQVIQEPDLTIPHPRLHERWFVLKPLWDLRADWIHPVFKKSICELLDRIHETHPKSK
ncbi:MAG: 2-amino-4-hydroxy-6-hydroxymethyldihydropteridine diphosphokinase [Candidatus Omnitrophica bacterium]|nr:2-amino-4-hydroxy-6-hydroxymethyldihydropteridine diphosphokinase [Candidatus Omnitrophota bacterium]